jgi:hypothetical protein
MTHELDALARAAYDAYGETTDHKNYAGLPMPAFDDLGDTIQAAWRASVAAVAREVLDGGAHR